MLIIALFLISVTLLVLVVQTAAFRRLYIYVERELTRKHHSTFPKASVILPCKGLDPGFRENVQKLLDQDYPDFEVIFAVAQESDPAYSHLVELSRHSAISSKVVVAGIAEKRSQKLNNQLHALAAIRDDSEILVFVDSDVIARKDFLQHLVAPLQDATIGATTGYRFYIASPGHWASMLRSLWNRITAWEMANPKWAFAWGGAMAIRRDVFDRAKILDVWDRAADDDLSLTTSVKKLGLSVHFVPQCLVATNGDDSFSEICHWTNRQLILTKVYYRQLWLRAIFRAFIMVAWLIAFGMGIIGWLTTRDAYAAFAVACGLSIVPVEVLFLIKGRQLWQKVLVDRKEYLLESFWSSCMSIPLAHLILPFITLASLLTNRIQWRGVVYELRSPTEILVISPRSSV